MGTNHLSAPAIRAAGGAVVRWHEGTATSGATILIVHRPRYDDWSLPKGKCQPGEAEPACALREVEEETGLRCTLGPRLTEIAYHDHKDRAKTVTYFLMEPLTGELRSNDEVDELRWATLAEAEELLTYARDVEIARLAFTQPR